MSKGNDDVISVLAILLICFFVLVLLSEPASASNTAQPQNQRWELEKKPEGVDVTNCGKYFFLKTDNTFVYLLLAIRPPPESVLSGWKHPLMIPNPRDSEQTVIIPVENGPQFFEIRDGKSILYLQTEAIEDLEKCLPKTTEKDPFRGVLNFFRSIILTC